MWKKQFNAILHKEIFQLWLNVSKKKCLQKGKFPEQLFMLIIKIMQLLLQDKCLRVQNVEQY